MGIAAGLAPNTALYDAIQEIYYAADRGADLRWTIGRVKWDAIRVLRDTSGHYLWGGYGLEIAATLMGYPVDVVYDDLDALRLENLSRPPSVGKTVQLLLPCRSCGGQTPAGAHYCIECGASL